jgi:N-formylglutamate amidohydrolase
VNDKVPPWVIFHVPHDSTFIPEEVRDQFVLDDKALDDEILKMSDLWTHVLLTNGIPASQIVAAPVNRLVVDVERFDDDAKEVMAKRGMGAVYRVRHDLTPLRRLISDDERTKLLAKWYYPHHKKLSDTVDRVIKERRCPVIVDLHSFPSKPLPYEDDQEADRPEICIGTDRGHTSDDLRNAFEESFSKEFKVAINRPFKGALVSLKHYYKNSLVQSIMVEVRRDLYMDEATGAIRADFGEVSKRLQKALFGAIQSYWSARRR